MPAVIHPTHRRAARQRRLALRAGHRRREAGPPDQQLPPPARRRHLRRVSAAARRVPLEELPDHGPRGDRRGQDQVHVQVASGRLARWPGGCSSVSPADRRLQGVRARAGCSSRRARRHAGPDPRGGAFVRRRPSRRSPGGSSRARPLPAPGRGRPARDRAADGEHAREARARARRQRAHAGCARLPRAPPRRRRR